MHLACLCLVQHVEDVASLKMRSKTGGVLQKAEEPNMHNWVTGERSRSCEAGCQGNNSLVSSPAWWNIVFLSSLPKYPQLQRSHSHSCRCFNWCIPNSTLGLFSWAQQPLKAPSAVPGLQKGLCCPEVCSVFPLVLAGLMSTWLLPTNFPLQK